MRLGLIPSIALIVTIPVWPSTATAQAKPTRPPDRKEREREEAREHEGKRPVISNRSGPDEPEEMEDLTRELRSSSERVGCAIRDTDA